MTDPTSRCMGVAATSVGSGQTGGNGNGNGNGNSGGNSGGSGGNSNQRGAGKGTAEDKGFGGWKLGLVITAVILFVALIGVTVYCFVRRGMPGKAWLQLTTPVTPPATSGEGGCGDAAADTTTTT